MSNSALKKIIITSLANPKIKELIHLRDSRYRRQSKLFIIEGCKEVKLALASKIAINEVYFCPHFLNKERGDLLESIVRQEILAIEVNEKVYSKVAFGERKEGIIAVARKPQFSLAQFKLRKNPLIIVMDSIEKPGNLGAVMRTMDAFGVDALIVSDPLTDIYNPAVVRSSLGAVFAVMVCEAKPEEVLLWLKSNNIKIICAAPGTSNTDYALVDFKVPSAIVFGNEEKGISKLWLGNADVIASIPMKGKIDSLNVSIAAAAFIFEASRQRNG